MKWTPAKITVFALLLAFYACALTHKISLPAADDLPRQIKIGELILQGNWDILYKNVFSFAEPNHRFFNHHWFSGVLFYLLYQVLGWGGLVVLKVGLFLAAFSLLFVTALKRANFWLVATLSLPALIVILERTGLRPEVFSYVFVAVYLWILADAEERPEKNWLYALIPLQLLWVNMHVFFSIGIMMTAGFVFQEALRRRKTWRTDPVLHGMVRVLVGVVAISFLNPRGVGGVFYRYPSNYPLVISENQSLSEYLRGEPLWEDPSIPFFYACVVLLAVSFFLIRKKRPFPVFHALAAGATSILGFVILRSLSLFGFVFLIVASANLQETFEQGKRWIAREAPQYFRFLRYAVPGILGLLCVLLVVPGWGALSRYRPSGIGPADWAEASGIFLKEQQVPGPIFCDGDIGSYLIFNLYPTQKVFADNRFGDAYSAGFYERLLSIYADEDEWNKALVEYEFNAIVTYHYGGTPHARDFLWRRLRDPLWVPIYGDPFVVILVRNTEANKSLIDRFYMTGENIEERLGTLMHSKSIADRISAADLFNLFGRPELARRTFLDVLVKDPTRGRVWGLMGQMSLADGDEISTVLATMFLERAIAEGRGTAELYGSLATAYARMGQTEKAIELLRTSIHLDASRRDTQELLHSLTKFQVQ